jgi:hypothetical protein
VSPLPVSQSVLVKPALDTRFRIDFDWWEREGRELRVDVLKHLRPESQEAFASYAGGETIDVVDPETAEVRVVDKLQHMLRTQCKPLETFQSEHSSLVDGVFHVFLLNGNLPLTPLELSERLNRPAQTILKTLAGRVVYKGLRPISDEA